MKKIIFAFVLPLVLAGCATNQPARPVEQPLSVKLPGTSVEVQHFIEQKMLNRGFGYQVVSADNRSISFKTDCISIPTMNAFKCSMIMMAVGNSRWDGPHAVVTFRTAEIRGEVNLAGNAQWCATNVMGKTNCMPNGGAAEMNDLLRDIQAEYIQANK